MKPITEDLSLLKQIVFLVEMESESVYALNSD